MSAQGRSTGADSTMDSLGDFVESQLQSGRELSGSGGKVDKRRLFRLLRDERLSAYPLLALLALAVGDSLAASVSGIVSPDISRTFGLNPQFFTSLMLVGQVLSFVVPLLVARFVQNRARRALVVLVAEAGSCMVTGMHGLVLTIGGLAMVQILDTVTSSAHNTVAYPLMIDLYPPAVRVRAISFLSSATIVTGLIATGVTAVLTGPMHLTWRGAYLVAGLVSLLTVAAALGLRDPGYGRHDTEKVREQVREALGRDGGQDDEAPRLEDGPRLTIFEAFRRIWMIRSMRIMLIASLVSALPAPVMIYMQFYLANRFSLTASQRALLALAGGCVSLLSFIVLAPVGDRIFQRSPKRLFYLSGGLGLLGSLLGLGQLFVYSLPALVFFSVIGSAFGGLTGPALTVGTQSIVPAPLRPHVGAAAGVFVLMGTAAGTALLGGLTSSLGIPLAITITTSIGMISTVMSMVAGRYVRHDLDAVVEEVAESEYIANAVARREPLPMLSVRKLDFGYGQTQVLFGVDLAVAEGEMIALLGVNGAGKSTLLRAISGLGICTRGSIRLQGHDVTYLDAERRVRLGITQVPGGRTVFGDLSVIDNLRCYAFGLPAGERKAATRRIDEALEVFPNLARRRDLPASALSGGEQQMLGLARSFILRPKLLLIDELSLGLAPKVVGELLDVVRDINSRGTAVILVEQSVNVALTVAERALFMERGQIRFDGPTEQLRDDSDLLRAVFLSGSKAVQG
ncbi:MFS transporter [Streptomyces sp. NPDC091217]|uniref:MFS transporter n=1 Tax=Streptomyces sp. NPDC091217 TaxID=3365975 RepID=UPI00380CE219